MPATLLRNPSADQIAETLGAALGAANKGALTRKVEFSEIDHWPAKVAGTAEGVLAADGGSVANSYKYAAETTDLVVAWWTSGHGVKSVRVAATRTRANHTSQGAGAGTSSPRGTAWEVTFPDRRDRLGKARRDRIARLLDRVGPEGSDDRLAILPWSRHLSAVRVDGSALLIADHPTRPKVVQVVVRDATTGQRHHITVPPKFATPASKTFQRLGSEVARIHAAVAWTFALTPAKYAPLVEA